MINIGMINIGNNLGNQGKKAVFADFEEYLYPLRKEIEREDAVIDVDAKERKESVTQKLSKLPWAQQVNYQIRPRVLEEHEIAGFIREKAVKL